MRCTIKSVALWKVIVAFVLTSGCVSKSTHNELLAEKAKLESRLQQEGVEKAAILKELRSRQMKDIEMLEVKLDACEQRIVQAKDYAKKAEEAGYYRGAADLNRSIQIIGAPQKEGWWIFADDFYTLQVRIAGEPLYSMTIETEQELPPTAQGVAMIAQLAKALTFKSAL
jgi:outer membrane murein-binding lipoprotein Lpp